MNKKSCSFLFTVFFLFFQFLSGQVENCPKIKVGVKIAGIHEEVFDHLNLQYKPGKQKAVWLAELGQILMKGLQENSPDLEFVYLTANPNADYDYFFNALFALTGGGKTIEITPETFIQGSDGNIFTEPPLYDSEYTEYKVWSSLIINSHCYPNRRYILAVEKGQSQDIYRAILSSLSGFGRAVEYVIYEREKTRPVPVRNPYVATSLEREYVSILTPETRKIKIYENVLNCDGTVPFFPYGNHSQAVKFPTKTNRSTIDAIPGEGCKLEKQDADWMYILVNRAGNAIAEYRLKRGLAPEIEKITLSTCPRGNKPDIEKEVEIPIRGLELIFDPSRKTIYSGDQVSVTINFNEVDTAGNRYPVANREITIQVTGLVDGTISPLEKVMTDEVGTAIITYKAGNKDKQIRITASFTPPEYAETVRGECILNVNKPAGNFNGTITYKRHVDWKDESEQPAGSSSMSVDLDENGVINVSAKLVSTFKEDSDIIELYEANQLNGNCSVVMKKTSIITDKDGNWTKIADSWQGEKMIDPESGSNLTLSVNTTRNTYTLQGSVSFQPIEGKTELSTSKGTKATTESAESWSLNANLDFAGRTVNGSINGNWSLPATDKIVVTSLTGLLPGCTWNWSLSRTNQSIK